MRITITSLILAITLFSSITLQSTACAAQQDGAAQKEMAKTASFLPQVTPPTAPAQSAPQPQTQPAQTPAAKPSTPAKPPQAAPVQTPAQSPTQKPPEGQAINPDRPIGIGVTNVTLPVIVTDDDGRFISNLTQENFEIFEDKKQQNIIAFEAQTELPLYLGILLDTSASVKGKLKFEKEATLSFLQTVLRRRKDQALLVTFDSTIEMRQDFTDDLNLLTGAMKPVKASGNTALYDAVYRICEEKMNNVPTPRKVIVVISDGSDTASDHTLQEAIEIAQRNEVVVFGISTKGAGFFGINGGTGDSAEDKELRQLCEETGGEIAFPGNYLDLERAFSNINTKSRRYYLLAYDPPDPDKPGYRKIEVKLVGRKGLKLRTRKGYNVAKRPADKETTGQAMPNR